jgi:hypothetical protein
MEGSVPFIDGVEDERGIEPLRSVDAGCRIAPIPSARVTALAIRIRAVMWAVKNIFMSVCRSIFHPLWEV